MKDREGEAGFMICLILRIQSDEGLSLLVFKKMKGRWRWSGDGDGDDERTLFSSFANGSLSWIEDSGMTMMRRACRYRHHSLRQSSLGAFPSAWSRSLRRLVSSHVGVAQARATIKSTESSLRLQKCVKVINTSRMYLGKLLRVS